MLPDFEFPSIKYNADQFDNPYSEIICYKLLKVFDLIPKIDFQIVNEKILISVDDVNVSDFREQSNNISEDYIAEHLFLIQIMKILHLLFYMDDFHDQNIRIYKDDRENSKKLKLKIIDFCISPAILTPMDVLNYSDFRNKVIQNNRSFKDIIAKAPNSYNTCGTKIIRAKIEQEFFLPDQKIKYYNKKIPSNPDTLSSGFLNFSHKIYPDMITRILFRTEKRYRLIYATIESINRLFSPAFKNLIGYTLNYYFIFEGTSYNEYNDNYDATYDSIWMNFLKIIFSKFYFDEDIKKLFNSDAKKLKNYEATVQHLNTHSQTQLRNLYKEIISFDMLKENIFSVQFERYHFYRNEEMVKISCDKDFNNYTHIYEKDFDQNVILFNFTYFENGSKFNLQENFEINFLKRFKTMNAVFVHISHITILDLYVCFLINVKKYKKIYQFDITSEVDPFSQYLLSEKVIFYHLTPPLIT